VSSTRAEEVVTLSRQPVDEARDDDAGATLHVLAGDLGSGRLHRTDRDVRIADPGPGWNALHRSTGRARNCSESLTRQLGQNQVNSAGRLVPLILFRSWPASHGASASFITDNVENIVDAFNSVPLAPPGQVAAGSSPVLRPPGTHGSEAFFIGYRQRAAVVVRLTLPCGFDSNGQRSGRVDDQTLLAIRRILDPLMQG
jgi:hypothetical protein